MDLEHNSCHITNCREDAEHFVLYYFGEKDYDMEEFRDNILSMVVGFCKKHFKKISTKPLNEYVRFDRILQLTEDDF